MREYNPNMNVGGYFHLHEKKMKMKQICMSELHSFVNGMRDAFTNLDNSF